MKILFSSPTSFNSKIPLSKYKGPILKLTKEEEIIIKSKENEIGKLILEKLSIIEYCTRNKSMSESLYHKFMKQVYIIDNIVQEFQEQIRNIKINRINEQRKSL